MDIRSILLKSKPYKADFHLVPTGTPGWEWSFEQLEKSLPALWQERTAEPRTSGLRLRLTGHSFCC